MIERPFRPEIDWPSLVELLQHQARTRADRPAYVFLTDGKTPGPSLTFGELDRRARALAGLLQGLGAAGERALLLHPAGIDFLIAFWGCLYANVISIPAPPPDALRLQRTLPRLKGIVEDARASIVLTTPDVLAALDVIYAQLPSLRELRWFDAAAVDLAHADSWRHPGSRHDTLAYLQYTSGSTSAPKGVMVSHGNLLHHSESIRAGCGYTPDSVTVTWLPHFHDYGLIQGLLQPLYNGNTCYLMSPLAFIKRPLRWLEAISTYRGTHTQAPNFAYDLCVRQKAEQRADLDLSCWEYAGNGAEPVHQDTLDRFCEAFATCGFRPGALSPAYGLAEATLVVSSNRPGTEPFSFPARSVDLERHRLVAAAVGEGTRRVVSCGPPMPGRTVIVVEPHTRRRCAADEIGELWVSDPAVACGYWERAEETTQTFHARTIDTDEGPFLRTGDLGFLHAGQVHVTGRFKDLIIIDGSNHYPQDLERTVEQSHPSVRPTGVAVFSVASDGEERLVVLAELVRGEVEPPTILAAVRAAVSASHELEPHAVVLLQSGGILKTSSGKVQRRACQAAFLDGSLPAVLSWTRPARPKIEPSKAPEPSGVGRDIASIESWLVARLSAKLGLPTADLDIHEPLSYHGLVSRDAVRLVAELEDWLGRRLSPVLVYQYPTIAALARHLADDATKQAASKSTPHSELRTPNTHEPIAVVGVGCRFPGADGPAAFWRLLHDGIDAVGEVPPDRWDLPTWYTADAAVPGKMSTRWGGFLERVGEFDAPFFGIVPAEAEGMDPQQRLLLEVSWEALEHAGLAPDHLAGSRTGVYVGVCTDDYGRLQLGDVERLGAYSGTGSALSIAANRLSYYFDFRGPSLAIDTACSSSLVAVHLAVEALRAGQTDLALAGGVNLILSPQWTVTFSQARMMSPTGRCRTFAVQADGYVRGEGCGVVVLKRLADAERDGDRILALVRGSAVNQDGRSNGLTAPNPLAQQAVIRQALDDADATPAEVGYVEAHGTGTPLGDPIEVQALAVVLGDGRQKPLLLGSVKTNIGHLEAAAGIAGLIKTILALDHHEVPPQLHFTEPNPLIPWTDLNVKVPTAPTTWPEGCRLAGVSSFGFGGTNAHIVLAAAPAPQPVTTSAVDRPAHVLTLSARSEPALRALAARHAEHMAANPDETLADVCWTANTTRSALPHRLALVASSEAQARERLATFAATGEADGSTCGQVKGNAAPRVAFLFTGQGAQYAGMAKQLYATCPTFGSELDRCAELLRPHLERPLLDVLFTADSASSPLGQTAYAQPALFAIGYSLAMLWQSWGVRPVAMLGHSLGEYTAACVAGVLSLEDALPLVATRARLMQALPSGGAMAVVLADEARVTEALRPFAGRLSIAALNGPTNIVISGDVDALTELLASLAAAGVSAQRLDVSHAFHSHRMEPVLADFRKAAATVEHHLPRLPLFGNLTGGPLTENERHGADYWCRHLREPVRFAEGIRALRAMGADTFVEMGPSPTLLGMARRCLDDADDCAWLPSLRRGRGDWEQMQESLGGLFVRGARIDWSRLDPTAGRRRLTLPTYPFQRQHYWLETPAKVPLGSGHLLDGLYEVRWLPASAEPPTPSTHSGCWLLLGDADVADRLARRLEAEGQSCVRVRLGLEFGQEDGSWRVCPETPEDFRRLLTEALDGRPLLGAVALWGLEPTDSSPFPAVLRSCSAALHLVQALAQGGSSARIWFVTRGTQSIGPEPTAIEMAAAPLWAFGRVLAREHPDMWGGAIDLDPQAADADDAVLWDELRRGKEDQVAIRGGRRFVARLVSRPEPSPANSFRPRPDATYLITGGLGGLGLRLAGWLVDNGARHLTLVGRRPPSAGAAEVLARLEQTGARVTVVSADISRPEDVTRLLATPADAPPLAGIFHAAGVLDDGVLLRLDRSRFETVLAAKAKGAWHFHDATRGLTLDCFVLFSSASALLGLPGQANYAAANAFLDALAHHRRAVGLPALSVNWGPWDDVGMAAQRDGRRWTALGLTPLSVDRGLALLGRLMQEPAPQVAVIPGDWHRRADAWPGRSSLLADLPREHPPTAPSDLVRRYQSAPAGERRSLIAAAVRSEVARLLGTEAARLDPRRGFFELGLDSLMAVELRNRLQAKLALTPALPASLVFDQPTLEALAEHLNGRLAHPNAVPSEPRTPNPEPRTPNSEPIAVVGLGCRFPGADGPEAFWRLLADGVDAVGAVPRARWDMDAFFDPDPDAPGKIYTRRGGFLAAVDQFDAAFFGIAPREAVSLDPQQRLLLEVAWEALENAALAPDRLAGSATGVYVGISTSDYGQLLSLSGASNIDTYYGTGNTLSAAAGRLSYVLGLRGPSLAVDTACSSSLVAVHLACQGLRLGECDTALAGGVSLLLSPIASVNLCRARMLAPDGLCKTFDASADGYVRGEGCGVIVLKRLADAERDGDRILALIRGSAVNQDGRSSGLTAPNGPAQQAVIRAALADGGVDPTAVSYIEAHGTGTPLGDPIEVQALAAVLGDGRTTPLLLGSVKTNIGHLEAAAGIAGIIKTILAIQHAAVPPHLNFRAPNPHIAWCDLPVAVPTTLTPWASDGPRCAGVSSFGFVGTNAHVVLEEAPTVSIPAIANPQLHLLTLSARDDAALRELAVRWHHHLSQDGLSFADAAFTANVGRANFAHRLAVLADSAEESCKSLAAFTRGRSAAGLFTGQVADLPETEHIASPPATEQDRRTLLETLARQYVGGAVIDWQGWEPNGSQRKVAAPTYPFQRQRFWLEETRPTLLPMRAAATPLGHRLRSAGKERVYESVWGTGTFPLLRDHRLFGTVVVPGAWHLAVALQAACRELGTDNCELHGVTFRAALALADAQDHAAQLVLVPQEDGLEFQLCSQPVESGEADVPWSLHAAGRLQAGTAFDQRNGMTSTLQNCPLPWPRDDFYRTMGRVGIELGPEFRWLEQIWTGEGRALARLRSADAAEAGLAPGLIDSCFQLVAAVLLRGEARAYVPVGIDCLYYFGRRGGPLWCHVRLRQGVGAGESITADVRLDDQHGNPVVLFEGLHARRAAAETLLRSAAKPTADRPTDALYEMQWRPAPRLASAERRSAAGSWLVLSDRSGTSTSLIEGLRWSGGSCTVAFAGTEYRQENDGTWQLDPTAPDQMARLLAQTKALRGVIHLWGLDEAGAPYHGCRSALHLTQALVRSGSAPRLWLVTRGAQPGSKASTFNPHQALVWGLGRTIAVEHPELHCTLLDLDPTPGPIDRESLLAEFVATDGEEQVALRQHERSVPRLVRRQEGAATAVRCRADGSYLVTGGLGALGLRVARWLAGQGAGHIVLLGRSGPSQDAAKILRDLEQSGVHVQICQVDVADRNALRGVLDGLSELRGIVHAAGVLDDGIIAEQTWERFERVLLPKVAGAWHLHELTQDLPLDFFVLYSSAAALLGSPGQANYAAANAFLDALAHHRRAAGLPALSINWGPWDAGGMAARADDRHRQRWEEQGIGAIAPERGEDWLGLILSQGVTQAGVLPIHWPRFLRSFGQAGTPRWLSEMASAAGLSPQSPTAATPEFLRRYHATPERERRDLLVQFLREKTAEVLRLPPAKMPGARTRFFEIGMDSLMAIELRSRLQVSLGRALPATLIFDHPTAETLADHLRAEVLAAEETKAATNEPTAAPNQQDEDPELDGLTDAEIEGLLERKLAALQARQVP